MKGSGQPPPPLEDSLLPTLRALMSCSRHVERVASRHVATFGLTHPQFDVIATLGDTQGMTVSEISERTLITRGTLKPVLDRLEEKGLIVRRKGEWDARQVMVTLTPEGQSLFLQTFAPHVAFLRRFIEKIPQEHQTQLIALLTEFEKAFT